MLLSYEGQVTAGAVVDLSGDRAVYLYGATDDRALALNAGYALHWNIVSYLSGRAQTRWYDLGGSDMDRGLHQFKKGFVGKSGVISITPPNHHYALNAKARLVGRFIFWAKEFKTIAQRNLHALKQRVGL